MNNLNEFYSISHEHMEVFRGMESNCKYAEAFIAHTQNLKKINLT
jgi:hypothetical protein